MGKSKRKASKIKVTDRDEESKENEDVDEDSLQRISNEKSGCISPLGCKIGISIDPMNPADAVPFACSNSICSIQNRFMHFECCEIYEDHLVDGLKRLNNKQYFIVFFVVGCLEIAQTADFGTILLCDEFLCRFKSISSFING